MRVKKLAILTCVFLLAFLQGLPVEAGTQPWSSFVSVTGQQVNEGAGNLKKLELKNKQKSLKTAKFLRNTVTTLLLGISFLNLVPGAALAESARGDAADLEMDEPLKPSAPRDGLVRSPRLSTALRALREKNFSLRRNREALTRSNMDIYRTFARTLTLTYKTGSVTSDSKFTQLNDTPNFFRDGVSTLESDSLTLSLRVQPSIFTDAWKEADEHKSATESYENAETLLSSRLVTAFFKYLTASSTEQVYELNKPFPVWLKTLAQQTPNNTALVSRIDSYISRIDSASRDVISNRRKAEVDFLSLVTVKPLELFDTPIQRLVDGSNASKDEGFDYRDLPRPEVLEEVYRRPVDITLLIAPLPPGATEAYEAALEQSSAIAAKKKLVDAADKDIVGKSLNIALPTTTVLSTTSNSESEALRSDINSSGLDFNWSITTDKVFEIISAVSSRKSAKLALQEEQLKVRVAIERSYIDLESVERQAEIALNNYVQGYAALVELAAEVSESELAPTAAQIEELLEVHQRVLADGIALRQLYDLYFIIWYNIELQSHESLDTMIPIIEEIERQITGASALFSY